MFYVRTHLGTYLNPGDYALGYDLTSQNFNEADLGGLRGRQVPDVVRSPLQSLTLSSRRVASCRVVRACDRS
jgi:hypothetical protein